MSHYSEPGVDYGFFVNGIAWNIDPYKKFAHYSKEDMDNLIGTVPDLVCSDDTDDNIAENAEMRYGQCLGGPIKGGTVTEKGVYTYPGDPDLYPIAMGRTRNTRITIYEYGITSFYNLRTKTAITYRFN